MLHDDISLINFEADSIRVTFSEENLNFILFTQLQIFGYMFIKVMNVEAKVPLGCKDQRKMY